MLNMNPIRIATRNSPLALWQANYVKTALQAAHPSLIVQIQGFLTEGDKHLTTSLAKTGGKGLFVKELEIALLEGKADIAVHSIKDMPAQQTPGLTLAAICEREDPRDAFVSSQFSSLSELPLGAMVGTSSSRRACLLRDLRPDLKVAPLRGNVGTRLRKLDEGQYDAIILAAAGLKRLAESARIRSYLETDNWVPAVGQGAVGIECREDDTAILERLLPLDHALTRCCITAERAFNQTLNGGCQLPIAAYAVCMQHELQITGFVAHPEKDQSVRETLVHSANDPTAAGHALAELLLTKGARAILADQ
jgi:hydroxymethylbilane synthase